MTLDRYPLVTDTDDDIVQWALARSLLTQPVNNIMLAGAIYEGQPDIAVITRNPSVNGPLWLVDRQRKVTIMVHNQTCVLCAFPGVEWYL